MPRVARYCKAYLRSDLREFTGWVERRSVAGEVADETSSEPVADVGYLHENYVVTDGIYDDEGVLFDRVTPEWIEFCKTVLKFTVPEFDDDRHAAASE